MSLASFYTGVNNTYLTPRVNSCSELIYGEGGDGNGVTKDLSYRFGKKKFIQEAVMKMKKKGTAGSFTRWCRSRGHSGVTPTCIKEGKRSKSKLTRKRAIFAQNIHKSSFGSSEHTMKSLLKDIKILKL
jgi:hypothetical protein